jgi:LmbE family N-acetylglucosaminyl deacetylase
MVSPSSQVLVVVAHPDDEVLGCGGTIAKLADAGHDVRVLLTTRRCDERGRQSWTLAIDAFKRSCRRLGATAVIAEPLLDEVCAEPNVHDLHDVVVHHVEAADVVFTHWPGDVNQVHRGVARAVEIATRPFRRRRDVFLFEVPTSTDQAFTRMFSPNAHVLLDRDHCSRKLDALACYDFDGFHLDVGRRPEDLRRQVEARGAEAGVAFAEAFVIARQFL